MKIKGSATLLEATERPDSLQRGKVTVITSSTTEKVGREQNCPGNVRNPSLPACNGPGEANC